MLPRGIAGCGRVRLRIRRDWQRRGPPRFARQYEQIGRQRNGKLEAGIDQACAAPPKMRVEECGKRPADGAGKAAKQRERGDCRASALPIEASEGREGRIVETRAHAESDQQPGDQKSRQRVRQRQSGQARRQKAGAHGQDRTTATARNGAADPRRNETGDQQPERQPAHHPGQRPAGVGGDRLRQNRREIIGRSPGEYLRHPQHRDDDDAARSFGRDPDGLAGGAAHAAAPHPQPGFPRSFATASATQQASTFAGAGPPQQPADAFATATGRVEQTPVSGSTSRTSSAAAMSPAIAAAMDRTCS